MVTRNQQKVLHSCQVAAKEVEIDRKRAWVDGMSSPGDPERDDCLMERRGVVERERREEGRALGMRLC